MQKTTNEIINEFDRFLKSNGIEIDHITADGQLHRAHNKGDKAGSKNIAYKLHLDGVPAGYVENFKTGLKATWKLEGGDIRPLTTEQQAEIEKARAERAKEQLSKQQKAAQKAAGIWQSAPLADSSHQYLTRKNIKPHGAKLSKDGELIIPVYDETGALSTLQFIKPDGDKRFLGGGRTGGCFWHIGKDTDTVLICEGYATGASLHESTGLLTVIAFNAGNLEPVTKTIRNRYPSAKIILCADNDETGIGQNKATKATSAIGGFIAIPPTHGDFNDHPDTITAAIANAQTPTAKAQTQLSNIAAALEENAAFFNDGHAAVIIGGKHRIMRKRYENGRETFEFISQCELEKLYQRETIITGFNRFGEVRKNILKAWAEHSSCTVYTGGVVFAPNQEVPDDCFNLWRGFAITPKANQAATSKIHDHIDRIICGGDSDLSEYVYNWMAYTIQNPEKPARAAIVCRGEKGSGKGMLGHFLMALWGSHALHIANGTHLVGRFNSHLRNVCFLFVDEAFFANDKAHENVLKALITEPVLTIEQKGIDAVQQPNFLKVFMATNSAWAVPASRDERRYCVLDVSSAEIGNADYFNALHTETTNPDAQAAFLHEMLNRDISTFNPSKIPETVGLKAQRMASLSSAGEWLVDSFHNGFFDTKDNRRTFWEEFVTADALQQSYQLWCDNKKVSTYDRMTNTALGRYLNDLGIAKKRTNSERGRYFGTLEEAIAKLEAYEKITIES